MIAFFLGFLIYLVHLKEGNCLYCTQNGNSCLVTCNSTTCRNDTLSVQHRQSLNIICNSITSCQYNTFDIGNITSLNIHCNDTQSCLYSTWKIADVDQLSIYCDSNHSCQFGNFLFVDVLTLEIELNYPNSCQNCSIQVTGPSTSANIACLSGMFFLFFLCLFETNRHMHCVTVST